MTMIVGKKLLQLFIFLNTWVVRFIAPILDL